MSKRLHELRNRELAEQYGIECKLCGIKFLRISNTHLDIEHDMTCKEYQEIYGKENLTSRYLKDQNKKTAQEKYSERMKTDNPMFNPKWYKKMVATRTSEESKAKHKKAMIESWQDPENYLTHSEACRIACTKRGEEWLKNVLKGIFAKPNKKEQKLIDLFKEHNLPYRYTGDGGFIINRKCPDFVNSNGQKKIIEHFGTHWHGEGMTGLPKAEHEQERKNVFKEFGYSTLIIWENELEDMNEVLEKVKEFDKEI